MVVRDRGVKKVGKPQGQSKIGAPPKPLTAKDKKAVLEAAEIATAPGTLYAKVDIASPLAPNQMSLIAVAPRVVNPMHPLLEFDAHSKGDPHYAGLWIKSTSKGARYLVDCSVKITRTPQGASGYPPFHLVAGSQTSTFNLNGQGHITWVIDSPDAGWHDYRVFVKDHQARWALFGCEVTNL